MIAQAAFHADGAVAEIFGAEDAADWFAVLFGFFEVAEQAGDLCDVFEAQLLALAAQSLAHLLPETGGICQLHLLPLRSVGLRLLRIQILLASSTQSSRRSTVNGRIT
ncbi:hypothetical protein [Vulcanococcus limneticus]|uniref:hypothetical protein n=1 Tax=Vulcanococcus limneticus TaxID=2170428 RepID=UPI00398BED3D